MFYGDVESCVEAMITRIGRRIRLGTPLGLGKANHIVNEFYRRARNDPHIDLRIFTALTLARPRWKSDLERRFVEPLAERLFGGYPELEYVEPLRRSQLPPNIRVNEFYFQPGSLLGSPLAQQQYTSSNYTHVVRDILDAGINVLAQLVAKSNADAESNAPFSLSCNPDLTLDLAPRMREAERRGQRIALLAQVNRNLPFMYGDLVEKAGVSKKFGEIVERVGGTGPFRGGLYASSEMLVHGLLELYRCGVLKRKVHDDADVQRRMNAGEVPGGAIDGKMHVAHACFFLGPENFYEALRRMVEAERKQICMTSIAFVNQLYGNEEVKRLQRKQARFVNSGLIVALSGAVASDALEDGRVLSGVGGQYNFVSMAHALEDGHSILLIRSTHEAHGKFTSNIRATYGSTTIPRHLRDIIVTEYGIADLRGRTDEEVAIALVQVADSRFQDELVREAQRAGKVAKSYRIPDQFRNNRPENLEATIAPYREKGLFDPFPFGTDLTREEVVLGKALKALQRMVDLKRPALPRSLHLCSMVKVPESARVYLDRMALANPHTLKERLLQQALLYALASVDAI